MPCKYSKLAILTKICIISCTQVVVLFAQFAERAAASVEKYEIRSFLVVFCMQHQIYFNMW